MSTPTLLGVQVARLILSGDVGLARKLAGQVTSWSVPEGRAIVGACQHVQSLGWPVRWQDFFS